MKIEKTFTVNAPQQQVWAFITSPEQVAPCIPGCEGATEIQPGKYQATIRIKVGPIKTAFKVDIERTGEQPPQFAAYETRGEEGSRASRIKASSTLTLRPLAPNQTEVSYTSEINIMGRLGKFGSGMMEKIADNIGNEFVAALKDRMEDKTGSSGQSSTESTSGNNSFLWWAIGLGIGLVALITIFVL